MSSCLPDHLGNGSRHFGLVASVFQQVVDLTMAAGGLSFGLLLFWFCYTLTFTKTDLGPSKTFPKNWPFGSKTSQCWSLFWKLKQQPSTNGWLTLPRGSGQDLQLPRIRLADPSTQLAHRSPQLTWRCLFAARSKSPPQVPTWGSEVNKALGKFGVCQKSFGCHLNCSWHVTIHQVRGSISHSMRLNLSYH